MMRTVNQTLQSLVNYLTEGRRPEMSCLVPIAEALRTMPPETTIHFLLAPHSIRCHHVCLTDSGGEVVVSPGHEGAELETDPPEYRAMGSWKKIRLKPSYSIELSDLVERFNLHNVLR